MGRWHMLHESRRTERRDTPFSAGDETRWPLLLQAAGAVLDGGRPDRLGCRTPPAGPVAFRTRGRSRRGDRRRHGGRPSQGPAPPRRAVEAP
ncbi:hypothetical protein ABZ614_19265 [Streptomyces sp. NPDC013178]|uniref:hypothetical protein n=1 Tax=unclassified Streptomyces TaxID=2593676 RepID=UPI0033D31F45